MKFLRVKRKSKFENRYHKNMGRICVKVISIKLYLFSFIPIKTYFQYRETYNGEIKELNDIKLDKV